MSEQITAFIKTMPRYCADKTTEGGRAHAQTLLDMEVDDSRYMYVRMSARPKFEVLHVYLCIAGKIGVRLNLASIEPGDSRKCFDGSTETPKFWAILTGPVSRAPEPIDRRGFQGHRYTPELW